MALSYGIKPLPINKALQLYDILGEFLPDAIDDGQIVDFVGKIVDNIASKQSGAYADAIMLMTNYDLEKLQGFSTSELLEMFTAGLIVNNIMELKKFCKEINYASD